MPSTMSENRNRTATRAGGELEQIKELLVRMFEVVDEQLADALNVIQSRDRDLATKVRTRDDVIDDLEMQIDRLAERALLTRPERPASIRFVMAAIKVNTDLERIGDHCRSIAKSALNIKSEVLNQHQRHFDRMIYSVRTMLYAAQDALFKGELSKAWDLVRDGHAVGRLHKETLDAIVTSSRSKRSFEMGARVYALSKSLERIADHSVNIAESALFLEEGIDVRHSGLSHSRESRNP